MLSERSGQYEQPFWKRTNLILEDLALLRQLEPAVKGKHLCVHVLQRRCDPCDLTLAWKEDEDVTGSVGCFLKSRAHA